jgi:hypothetical protein
MKAEIVYVIGSPNARPVKIGRSTDLLHRLGEIQNHCPIDLRVRWFEPGGASLETALHRTFKMQRMHGEWFDFGQADPVAMVISASAQYTELPLSDESRASRIEAITSLNNQLDKIKTLRGRLREREEEARVLIARALAAGYAGRIKGFRAEVQRHSPFSAPIVREIGDEAGIPPDERYVRTPKREP